MRALRTFWLVAVFLAGAVLLTCDDKSTNPPDEPDFEVTVYELAVRNDELIAAGDTVFYIEHDPDITPFLWCWRPPNWEAQAEVPTVGPHHVIHIMRAQIRQAGGCGPMNLFNLANLPSVDDLLYLLKGRKILLLMAYCGFNPILAAKIGYF